jgi:ribosomal protein S12 methylthiotransferase accessory factor
LARFARHAGAVGLTRIANVTGLDYLGVPVFMSVRPNARSLSVAQGKGFDEKSARVSAFMEAVEMAHAEQPTRRLHTSSYAEMGARARVPDPNLLPQQKGRTFRRNREIAWIAGNSLRDGETVWVPHDLVHLDFTRSPRLASGFLISSNGLASGNHPLEALCAGLYEVIERDATALWRFQRDTKRAEMRLLLSSVTDPDCRSLLDRLHGCEMSVAVWDVTTDIGVASFLCRIREAPGNTRSQLGSFWGSGCHLSRNIALSRAVTEAVQSRLTYIAGSRDDLHARDYIDPPEQALFDLVSDIHEQRARNRRFEDVPDFCSKTFEEDLRHLISRLAAAHLTEIVMIDLTRPSIGIPVVRVIVPGLEGMNDFWACKPGPRARALLQARAAA